MKISQKTIEVVIEICAIPILCWAVWRIPYFDAQIVWLGLMALASIPLLYPVGLLFMGLPFLMAISIIYGVCPCILATVPYAFLGAAFLRNCSIHRKFFVFAFLICNAFLYSSADSLANLRRVSTLGNIVLEVTVMIAVAFGFSFMAREKDRWKENVHLAYSFIIAGTFAGITAFLARYSLYIPFVVLPLMGIAWGYGRLLQERHHLLKLLKQYQIPKPAAPWL